MSNLKIFLRCCCDSSPIDEIQENPPKSILASKKNLRSESQQQTFKDTSIFSTPSPFSIKDSQCYSRLILKVIESASIPQGTILTITASGLEGTKRKKSDLKVYFGSQLTENGEVINDYVINEESYGLGKQHFMIKFEVPSNKYFISDLGEGTGTFIRIGFELVLKQGFIISFGNSHLKVLSISQSSEKKITLKFIEGPKSDEEYFFDPSDSIILIGRMADCRIRFEDSNLSRYQCSLLYEPLKGWVLRDGIGDKKSTNGTWLYVEEDFEICHKLIFKAGRTLFESNIDE